MAATMTLTATEHDFSHYLQTRRPWFTLFNVRLRPAGTQQKQVCSWLVEHPSWPRLRLQTAIGPPKSTNET